jgi:nitrite reductase/ring-hydroxylating ferredoxin subunit
VTRLAPVPFEEWDTDALSVIMGGRPLVPSNVLGLFANHPPLAKAFLTWNGYLLSRASTITPHIRELAILRIAWRRRCRYEEEGEPKMPHFAKPAEGSWTGHYPELGTSPVDYTDSIDPAYYEAERTAVFRHTWLNVGRVEQVPRTGSYFTKELAVVDTSLVIVRGRDGEIRAFHNMCRHRGNKLVWNDYPGEEIKGSCRQFTCKYHAWRYSLDGELTFKQQEEEFGLFGPWDRPDIAGLDPLPPALNPARQRAWGVDSFHFFPNFMLLVWAPGWYLTYHYWPTAVDRHIFEANLYFVPSKTAAERLAHELAAVTFKEYSLQDANTLEATQTMLKSRVISEFPLCDQELLLRALHKVTADYVANHGIANHGANHGKEHGHVVAG